MSRRFVIAATGLNAEMEKELRDYLGQRGGWWHWISNFWLFKTDDTNVSAAELRDKILSMSNSGRIMVMEIVDDVTWSAFGPNKDGKNMFKWLKETWS